MERSRRGPSAPGGRRGRPGRDGPSRRRAGQPVAAAPSDPPIEGASGSPRTLGAAPAVDGLGVRVPGSRGGRRGAGRAGDQVMGAGTLSDLRERAWFACHKPKWPDASQRFGPDLAQDQLEHQPVIASRPTACYHRRQMRRQALPIRRQTTHSDDRALYRPTPGVRTVLSIVRRPT